MFHFIMKNLLFYGKLIYFLTIHSFGNGANLLI